LTQAGHTLIKNKPLRSESKRKISTQEKYLLFIQSFKELQIGLNSLYFLYK